MLIKSPLGAATQAYHHSKVIVFLIPGAKHMVIEHGAHVMTDDALDFRSGAALAINLVKFGKRRSPSPSQHDK